MKKGFTLAEILITLGIIGVVSALTIPTLVKRNTNETHVQQLKKVYATLSEAAETALMENNVRDLSDTVLGDKTGNNGPKNFLNEYFKVSIDCSTTPQPCFADSYKTMDGEWAGVPPQYVNPRGNCVSLSDGTAMCITAKMPSRSESGWDVNDDRHTWVQIFIDVNGPKGPNIAGRDLFDLNLYSDGKVGNAYTETPDHIDTQFEGQCQIGYGGGACFPKIVADGWKMDY